MEKIKIIKNISPKWLNWGGQEKSGGKKCFCFCFCFQKIWCALFSFYLRFKIRPFAFIKIVSGKIVAISRNCKKKTLHGCLWNFGKSIWMQNRHHKKHFNKHNNQNYESIFTYIWSFFFRWERLRLYCICEALLETSYGKKTFKALVGQNT